MHCLRLAWALVLAAPTLAAAAEMGDATGRTLHDHHCLSCHTTQVYTRKDHFIHSERALRARVVYCARNAARVDWDAAQVDAVTGYLAHTYYHFSP